MLLPSQVIAYLQHPDKYVRDLAVRYLSQAHDPSPATAEDIWRLLDRFGFDDVTDACSALAALPHTEASLTRTLKAVEDELDPFHRSDLEDTLDPLHYGLLNRFRDVVEAAPGLSKDFKSHIAERFALASVPPAELWERLLQTAAEMDKAKTGDPNGRLPWRLVEALSRHPEAAQWAVGLLNESPIDKWRHVLAVNLLGHMRHAPAVELVGQAFASAEGNEGMLETGTDALIRIGGPQVVQIIRDRFAAMPWELRLFAADVLSGVKLPQGEAALIALMEGIADRSLRTKFAIALCEAGVTEPAGLEILYALAKSNRWDTAMTDLRADVFALFTMVGHSVPELSRWRAELDEPKSHRAERARSHARLFADSGISTHAAAAPGAPARPIRRQAAKVGRNDPCPCGSGKKYKKCCGR
jgi:hypothetical protein